MRRQIVPDGTAYSFHEPNILYMLSVKWLSRDYTQAMAALKH